MALLAFAAAIIVPTIKFEMQRDREEELIHRGVQYSRAIRRYTKATGRYPMRLDDLKGTPQVRYLRKLYKDPVTGKDFRLVRMREVEMGGLGGAAGNVNQHKSATDASNGTDDPNNPDGTPGSGQNSQNPDFGAAPAGSPLPPPAGQSPSSGFGSNTGFGSSPGINGAAGGGTNGPNAGGLNNSINAGSDNLPATEAFVGVASTSKQKSIREFDHKNHYKDWLFFYSSTFDRGFEIKGPTSMSAQANTIPGLPGGLPGIGGIPGLGGQAQSPQGSFPGQQAPPIQQSPPSQ